MRKTIETNIEMTEILIFKLHGKDYGAAITKMLQQAITVMLETWKKGPSQKKNLQRNRQYEEPNGYFRT